MRSNTLLSTDKLKNSRNDYIVSLKGEKRGKWLCVIKNQPQIAENDPVKLTEQCEALLFDSLRNIYFNEERFADSRFYHEHTTNPETYSKAQAFVNFIKEVLFKNNEIEFNQYYPQLVQHWNQWLYGLGKTVVVDATAANGLLAETDYVANVSWNNERKLVVNALNFNYRFKDSSAKGSLAIKWNMPGTVATQFVLEPETESQAPGFKLNFIKPSNSLFKKACMEKTISIDKLTIKAVEKEETKKRFPIFKRKKGLTAFVAQRFRKLSRAIDNFKTSASYDNAFDLELENILLIGARLVDNPFDAAAALAFDELKSSFAKKFPGLDNSLEPHPARFVLDRMAVLSDTARSFRLKRNIHIECAHEIRQLGLAVKQSKSLFKSEADLIYKELKNTKLTSIDNAKLLTAIAKTTNYLLSNGNKITHQDITDYRELAYHVEPVNNKLSKGMFAFGIAMIVASTVLLIATLGFSSVFSALGISTGAAIAVAASTFTVASALTGKCGYSLFKPPLQKRMENLAQKVEKELPPVVKVM